MKKINLLFCALFFVLAGNAQVTSTFDDLTLGVDTYWTGSNLAGGFSDGNAYFENQYDTTYADWSGFVYSDKTDTVTAGYYNQGSAITGIGYAGSHNYAVAYDDGGGAGNVKIRLTGSAAGKTVEGFYITNTTYAYLSMLNGDNFEHAFDSANADFFLLQITGWLSGQPVGDTVNFYLADFTSPDSTQRYIIKDWQWVNLLQLGNVDSLVFQLYSSQNSIDTINDSTFITYANTPTYFAMDNFVTSDLPTLYDTLKYNQDTIINVLAGVGDTTGGPYTVYFVSNTIYGSSVVIDSQNLMFYIPEQGVVGADTVTYVICNASNQCDTAVIVFYDESPSGITKINALQSIIYPNPCHNSFSVYHTGDVKTIELLDMNGKLIREIPCQTGELVTTVESGNLAGGVYLVKLLSDEAIGITKITKQ